MGQLNSQPPSPSDVSLDMDNGNNNAKNGGSFFGHVTQLSGCTNVAVDAVMEPIEVMGCGEENDNCSDDSDGNGSRKENLGVRRAYVQLKRRLSPRPSSIGSSSSCDASVLNDDDDDFHFCDAHLALVDASWCQLGDKKAGVVAAVYAAAIERNANFAEAFGICNDDTLYSRCMHLHPSVRTQAGRMVRFLDCTLQLLVNGDEANAVRLLRRAGAAHATKAPDAFADDLLESLTECLYRHVANESAAASRLIVEPVERAWRAFVRWMVPELKKGLYAALKCTRCRVVKIGLL